MDYYEVNLDEFERFIETNDLGWEYLLVEELGEGRARIYNHQPRLRRAYEMKINTEPMRERIIKLCSKDQRYADDDKLLIATIWYQDGWNDPELYLKLKKMVSPETIRRTRAKLVQEGIIKPSEEVQEARYKDYKEAMDNL